MRRRELLDRIARGSTTNVRFSDFTDLVEGFGYRLRRTKGSHHVYSHPDVAENINLQPLNAEAKPYQIRQLMRFVERYNLTLEDE